MKASKHKTYRLFSFTLSLLVLLGILTYRYFSDVPDDFAPNKDLLIADDLASENHEARWQYELEMLKDPATGKIPEGMRAREMNYALRALSKVSDPDVPILAALQSESTDATENNSFQSYGPFNLGGRTRALALDVNDEDIIIAGGVSGGVWRSTDAGQSWTKTTNPRDFPPVSSIVQDRRVGHTAEWYFAGGELFGNSGAASGAFYFGDGIYKSTDGGLSWAVIPATQQGNNVEIERFSVINELAIDLSNTASTEIYAAGPGNIMRTTDEFMTATIVLGQENNGFNHTDVLVSPSGVVYAAIANSDDNGDNAEEGVFRSVDGVNWVNVNPPSGLPATYNRLELALDPNDENTLYLIGGSQAGANITDFLLRYNHATNTWTDLSANMSSSNDIGDGHHFQGGYNLYVSVHPGASGTVFIGGTNLLRSSNGFASQSDRKQVGGYQPDDDPDSFENYIGHHPDQHTAVYLPSDANVMITGNDGGIYRTENSLENAAGANPVSWQSLNNGYVTSQFYAIDWLRNTRGDIRIPGGMQDNGSWINYTNEPDGAWTKELGGDGAFTALTYNSLYMSSQEGQLRRFRLAASGEFNFLANIQPSADFSEFLFINPFIVDPVHREKLFVAAQGKVYFTRDITANPGVGEWQTITNDRLVSETVSALAASIQPEGVLYFGTRNGGVYKVNDTRRQVTAFDITGANMPDGATVSAIAVDPADANRVFVTFSNYNVISIWMSEDGGDSWQSIAGNMEENPNGTGAGPSVRWIALLPDGNGGNLYFIATSVGLFMADELGGVDTQWVAQSENTIGRSLTNMIKVRPVEGQIAVSTHGNGVFVGSYDVLNSPTINYSVIIPDEEVVVRAPTSTVSGAGFGYEWLRDGEVISGAAESELIVNEPGTYQLRLTDEVDNRVSVSNELVLNMGRVVTSLDPESVNSVKVLNNPSNGLFTIIPGSAYAGGFALRVVDANGKQVWRKSYTDYQQDQEIVIDLTDQPNGLFLINIANGRGQKVIKLLKR